MVKQLLLDENTEKIFMTVGVGKTLFETEPRKH